MNHATARTNTAQKKAVTAMDKLWDFTSAILLSISGGLARLVHEKDITKIKWGVIGWKLFLSGFCGLMSMFLAYEYGLSKNMSGLLYGMAGFTAPWILVFIKEKLAQILGMKEEKKEESAELPEARVDRLQVPESAGEPPAVPAAKPKDIETTPQREMEGIMLSNESYVKLREMIKNHEGLKLKPYECTAGRWTIGYGHNLDAHKETPPLSITQAQAEQYLDQDISTADCDCVMRLPYFTYLDEVRKAVLIDMCFNLGINGLLGFKKTNAAIMAKDYYTAAAEMLDSKWATQVGIRARRLSRMMIYGVWPTDIYLGGE